MIKVGLTGGIGSGKSYVAALLEERGIPVYDSDSNAKRLMVTDAAILDKLRILVGDKVVCGNSLNRKLMADYVFGNPEHAAAVNAIVHPRVFADFDSWADGLADVEICVFESAILFESGFAGNMDVTVCVHAPLDVRVRRCMVRDSVSAEKITERVASQMGQAEKCGMSDFVILNDGVAELEPQILELIQLCKNKS